MFDIEKLVHELVQFNPNYHPDEPNEMLLYDIVEAFKESVELRVLLETIILNKENEEVG